MSALDTYVYVVPAAGITTGAAFTLPYAAGRAYNDYLAAGHSALCPNESVVAAPTRFTATFNAPSIAIVWSNGAVAGGSLLKFQLANNDGPKDIRGREVALADGSNLDLSGLGMVNPLNAALLGIPTAPTAAPGTNTTQIATTAFSAAAIAAAIAALIASSPATLDTLNELAAALGNDPAFSTTVLALIGGHTTSLGTLNTATTVTLPAAIALKLDIASKAVASTLRVGTDNALYLTAKVLYDAAAVVALTDAATVADDLSTGSNFSLTIGGNRTLGFPTNPKVGQGGVIEITQDGTGSRTLSYGVGWKREGGAPTLGTAAGAKDYVVYQVITSTLIVFSFIKAPS